MELASVIFLNALFYFILRNSLSHSSWPKGQDCSGEGAK